MLDVSMMEIRCTNILIHVKSVIQQVKNKFTTLLLPVTVSKDVQPANSKDLQVFALGLTKNMHQNQYSGE